MTLRPLLATLLAASLAAAPVIGMAAGTDEPPPAPKPAPKPEPKPDSKDAPKAVRNGAIDPDFAAGRSAVEAKEWKMAINLLSKAVLRDPDNANIHNYLGYSNRHEGNWETAMQHYRTALKLNPEHRGATEYIGQAYLLRGNMQLAQGQLAHLERLCGRGCDEYASLAKAIEEHRTKPR